MSVNLEGLVPVKTIRFGGLATWDDALMIPNGLAIDIESMAFLAESVKTRWGLQPSASAAVNGNPTGTDVLTVLGTATPPTVQQQAGGAIRSSAAIRKPIVPPAVLPTNISANVQVGLSFTDTGELLLELPAGSGNLFSLPVVPAAEGRIAASIAGLLPVGSAMQTTKAYNRIYQAFSNLVESTGPVLAFDAATGFESPVGQNPIAAVWTADTFYQQGDIVTSSVNPAVWWRRLVTGYSGNVEPTWPLPPFANQGYFTAGYVPVYAIATDNSLAGMWQEWTMGVPTFLPAPAYFTQTTNNPGAGTIPAGKDVYVTMSYFNDLGGSLLSQPILALVNSTAGDAFTMSNASLNGGPYMPSWLMSVMGLGTTAAGLHWPGPICMSIYVAAVPTGNPAPTQYGLYGTARADGPIQVTSIPATQTISPPTLANAAISTEQFMGEPGIRQAVLLRQNSMGDLSGIDPQCAMGVRFLGTSSDPADISVGAFVPQLAESAPLTVNITTVKLENLDFTIPSGTYYAQVAKVVGGQEVAWSQVSGPFDVVYFFYDNTYLITMQVQLPGDGLEDSWNLYYGTSPTELTSIVTDIPNNVTTYDVITAGTPTSGSATTAPLPKYMYLVVDDITEYAPGMPATVQSQLVPEWSGTYDLFAVYPALAVGWDGNFQANEVAYPQGTLVIYNPNGFQANSTPSAGTVSFVAGPCPVAVVPPGCTEGPGYGYDIVAFSVVGLSSAGPFNYLATADPATPFSTSVLSEGADGNGNAFLTLGSTSGLAAGDTVLVEGWPDVNTPSGAITEVTISAAGILTVAVVNSFQAGADVEFLDLATAAFLNGQSVTLLSASPTEIVATFAHAAYGPAADTGTVENVQATSEMNGQRVLATVATTTNTVSLPDFMAAGSYPAPTGVTLAVVQTQPTLAVPGTVGILLQFDDETLPEGVDVTGNLLFVAVPECIDVSYLPSVQRNCYVSDSQPTTLIFSEASFMGEVDGLNDVLAVEQSNGARVLGARELLNGMIVCCKETGGYQIVPTADVPANWGIGRLWGEHGPWSGRNIATARDASSAMDFLIFVDPDAGVFKWPPTPGMGELDNLSLELSGANNQDASRKAVWDRVNRAAGQQIQVVIDSTAKEIKVAVPLDGALTPSHILTMSYFNGWNPPLMMTLSGDWVPNRAARRWNIDPIPTRAMAMVKRTLQVPVDQRVNYRQLLIGAFENPPAPAELLYMQPGVYNDQGAGIVSRYRPAYAREAPTPQWPNGGRVLRFVAATGRLIGSGTVYLTAITDRPDYQPEAQVVDLNTGQPESPGSAPVTHYNVGLKGDAEFLTVEFSSVNPETEEANPGDWFQIMELTLWHNPLVPTR